MTCVASIKTINQNLRNLEDLILIVDIKEEFQEKELGLVLNDERKTLCDLTVKVLEEFSYDLTRIKSNDEDEIELIDLNLNNEKNLNIEISKQIKSFIHDTGEFRSLIKQYEDLLNKKILNNN